MPKLQLTKSKELFNRELANAAASKAQLFKKELMDAGLFMTAQHMEAVTRSVGWEIAYCEAKKQGDTKLAKEMFDQVQKAATERDYRKKK